jgi:hypothetical protein
VRSEVPLELTERQYQSARRLQTCGRVNLSEATLVYPNPFFAQGLQRQVPLDTPSDSWYNLLRTAYQISQRAHPVTPQSRHSKLLSLIPLLSQKPLYFVEEFLVSLKGGL